MNKNIVIIIGLALAVGVAHKGLVGDGAVDVNDRRGLARRA